jgi:integrase
MGISKRTLVSEGSWGFLFRVSPVLPPEEFQTTEGIAVADQRITKRVVDGLKPLASEFAVWDSKLPGFGVRVRPTGAMSYIVVYRAGSGRGAPVRRYTIANVGKVTPETARRRAKGILGAVAHGHDPAGEKAIARGTLTISELADRFMAEHVEQKRKPGTAIFYRHLLDKVIRRELGATKADKLKRAQVARLHGSLKKTPFQANRVLAVIGSMYAFAGRSGVVPEGVNPARRIEQFKEPRRERFLTGKELERLGSAIREAETKGIPWDVDEGKPKAKHLPKAKNRFTKIGPFAAAAIRLLLFTGCRLREILHLKWEQVDLERGLLFLADSKTGRKTVILNAPALAVLANLERLGSFVVPGDDPEKPRADLKRPWEAVAKRAGLDGVRLHDLRHTYASFGAGGGLGLPIIGKLLGHTQASTTQRYAHLDADPLRRASEAIGGRIAAALEGKRGASVVRVRGRARP